MESVKNHAVKLNAKGEKALRSEHPWIFESSIVKLNEEASAGDKAIIYAKKSNKFLGLGLIDPYSPIRIKMLLFKKSVPIDQAWFIDCFEKAYKRRKSLLETDTNSYRLIFGENDGFPGLIIDIYAEVAVIKLYSHVWYPYLTWIQKATLNQSNVEVIVLRLSRNLQKNNALESQQDGQVLYGELKNETVIFREHGILFSANVIQGHKTGYFLDHRENRRKVGGLSKTSKRHPSVRVLDVFSYAGGFSIHALTGGASSVTSVDISKQALELARFNAALNGDFDNHETLAGDAFAIMKKLINEGKKYELVVVDPPSFAKQASEVDTAIRSYERLTRLAIQLTARNGMMVLASCSSRIEMESFEMLVAQQLDRQHRSYQITERTQHDVDHPIGFKEGAYLKCLYILLDSPN